MNRTHPAHQEEIIYRCERCLLPYSKKDWLGFFFLLFTDDITEENPTATVCFICYCETSLLSAIFRLLLRNQDGTDRITAAHDYLIAIQIDLSNKVHTKASRFRNYHVRTFPKITDSVICCHTVEKSNKLGRTKADSFSRKALTFWQRNFTFKFQHTLYVKM